MALEQALSHALALFARAVRARNSQASTPSTGRGEPETPSLELLEAFHRVFEKVDEVAVSVEPDAFLYGDQTVLVDRDAHPSVPFLFYRDGIRRMNLQRGFDARELDLLLDAASMSASRAPLDDDVVSYLWLQRFDHVSYVTATEGSARKEIETLIAALHPRSSNEPLQALDPRAQGFFPSWHFLDPPAYARRLLGELREEDEASILELATSVVLEALARSNLSTSPDPLSKTLLAIMDLSHSKGHSGPLKRVIDWVAIAGNDDKAVRMLLEADRLVWLARHEDPEIRSAIIAVADRLLPETMEEALAELLLQSEPRARADAIEQLKDLDPGQARRVLESAMERPDFVEMSASVKGALLEEYAVMAGHAGLEKLEVLIEAADRSSVDRRVEETAAAAVMVLASLASVRTAEVLERACRSKSKRVRVAARLGLESVRKGLE